MRDIPRLWIVRHARNELHPDREADATIPDMRTNPDVLGSSHLCNGSCRRGPSAPGKVRLDSIHRAIVDGQLELESTVVCFLRRY